MAEKFIKEKESLQKLVRSLDNDIKERNRLQKQKQNVRNINRTIKSSITKAEKSL